MRDENENLVGGVRQLATGRYAVGVSGGADSVALLHLMHHRRPDCALHVVHLDHQTRGEESTGDGAFVRELAMRWRIPCVIATRQEVEGEVGEEGLPKNRSARFRAVRHALFRRVLEAHALDAVLLGHNADDQAETVFQRLLRGPHVPHLVGMSEEMQLGELRMIRPLLRVRRERLRAYLVSAGQAWREDASNASGDYLRNRIRRVLAGDEEMVDALLRLHDACAIVRGWIREGAPRLEARFRPETLATVAEHFAHESARRWLIERGVPAGELTPGAIGRLVGMCADAAVASRQMFPGGVTIRRRGGWVEGIGEGIPNDEIPNDERMTNERMNE